MGRRKWYMIFSLTDETYSLLCSVKTPEGIDAGDMRYWIAMLDPQLLDPRRRARHDHRRHTAV